MSAGNKAQDMLPLKLDIQTAPLATYTCPEKFRTTSQGAEMGQNFSGGLYQPLVAQVEERGYSFSLLSALRNAPDLRQNLYRLVQEGVLNSPQSDGKFESFDDFCERLLQTYYLDVADSYVIATFETEWVGLSGIVVDRETQIGKSGLTVVKKAHQGKGIAKALKVLSLMQAAKQGATVVVTGNHKDNAPMLAINQLFGFVPNQP